jgi:hypothetical protein
LSFARALCQPIVALETASTARANSYFDLKIGELWGLDNGQSGKKVTGPIFSSIREIGVLEPATRPANSVTLCRP